MRMPGVSLTKKELGVHNKDLEHYRGLKYPMELVEDDGAYVASIPDLPGCVAYGDTLDEAVGALTKTKELWIRGKLESGQPVPEPSSVEDYSGRFVLRIPRVLHKSLDRESKAQGTSLNQYILHLLSERHKTPLAEQLAEAIASRLRLSPAFAEPPTQAILWLGQHTCTFVAHGTKPGVSGLGNEAISFVQHLPKLPKTFRTVMKRPQLTEQAAR